jgi:hypothetical protein
MLKCLTGFILLTAGMAAQNAKPSYDCIQLKGIYNSKNLYVQNPKISDNKFCIVSLEVNKIIFNDSLDAAAIEIHLDRLKLKNGDSVDISIYHHSGCKPKVIPAHSDPRPVSHIADISLGADSVLKWMTVREEYKLPFIIEQFKWNKWVKVSEVDGRGSSDTNFYSMKIVPHTGENKLRVKQQVNANASQSSKTVTWKFDVQPVELVGAYFSTEIEFSAPTGYELFNQKGDFLKRGYGKKIETSKLPKGLYYINYDNTMGEMLKN